MTSRVEVVAGRRVLVFTTWNGIEHRFRLSGSGVVCKRKASSATSCGWRWIESDESDAEWVGTTLAALRDELTEEGKDG